MDGYAVSRPQGATQNCELPLDGVRGSASRRNEFIPALQMQCFFVFTGKRLMMPVTRFKLLLLLLLGLAAQSANAGQANYIIGPWKHTDYVESLLPWEHAFLVAKSHDQCCPAGLYRVVGFCSDTENTPIPSKNDCHVACPDYQNQAPPIHSRMGYQNEIKNDYSFSGQALNFDRFDTCSTRREPSMRGDNSRIQFTPTPNFFVAKLPNDVRRRARATGGDVKNSVIQFD